MELSSLVINRDRAEAARSAVSNKSRSPGASFSYLTAAPAFAISTIGNRLFDRYGARQPASWRVRRLRELRNKPILLGVTPCCGMTTKGSRRSWRTSKRRLKTQANKQRLPVGAGVLILCAGKLSAERAAIGTPLAADPTG